MEDTQKAQAKDLDTEKAQAKDLDTQKASGGGAAVSWWVEASSKGTFGLALSRFCHLQPVVCSLE